MLFTYLRVFPSFQKQKLDICLHSKNDFDVKSAPLHSHYETLICQESMGS